MAKTIEIPAGTVELPGYLSEEAGGVLTLYFRNDLLNYFLDRKTGICSGIRPQWRDVFVVYSHSPRATAPIPEEHRHFSKSGGIDPLILALERIHHELEDFWCAFVYGRRKNPVALPEPLPDNLPKPDICDLSEYELLAVVKVSDNALPP